MLGDTPGGPIRWRINIPANAQQVYDALDTRAGREGFWAESAEEINGRILFRFAGGARGHATVLDRLRPTYWSIDYFGSTARFELTDDGRGGTDVFLCHGEVPDEDWQEVHAGWLNVLFPMKAFVAYGIDLRNKDPARSWERGFADK